jgi:serine/threonine-protein kinase
MAIQTCYTCGARLLEGANHCSRCRRPVRFRDGSRVYVVRRAFPPSHFSSVYEAVDTSVAQRRCAIKVLLEESADDAQRIASEVEILAHLHLPFVPAIYSYWRDGPRHHIVMQYVSGETLDRARPRPWADTAVVDLLRQLLGYLEQLHARGVVHCDIKPTNIKLDNEGRFVLLDFNLAGRASSDGNNNYGAAPGFTRGFAPPEQIRYGTANERSDLYSLAATAYYLLFDEPPAASTTQLRHTSEPLATALAQMLRPNPEDRPPDARAALQLLMPGLLDHNMPDGEAKPQRATATNAAADTLEQAARAAIACVGAGRACCLAWAGTGADQQLVVGTSLGIAIYPAALFTADSDPLVMPREAPVQHVVSPGRDTVVLADGRLISSLSLDVQRARSIVELPMEEESATLRLAPDGRWAAALVNGYITMWSLDGSGADHRVTAPPTSFLLALGEKLLAVACDDGVLLLHRTDGSPMHRLALHDSVTALAFVGGDQQIVIATGGEVRLWTPGVVAGAPIAVDLPGPIGRIAAGSSAGRLALASATHAAIIRPGAHEEQLTLPALPAPIDDLAFAPDGQTLALIAAGSVWRYRSRDRLLLRGPGEHRGPMPGLVASADGRTLVSVDDALHIWEVIKNSFAERATLSLGQSPAGALALSADGTLVALSYTDDVRVLQLADGAELGQLPAVPVCREGLAFTGAGELLVATAAALECWAIACSMQLVYRRPVAPGATVAIAPDGCAIAMIYGSTVQVWRPNSAASLWEHQVRIANAEGVLATGGNLLALVGDTSVQVWRVGDAEPLAELDIATEGVVFSPDGARLATITGTTIQVWQLGDSGATALATLVGHTEAVRGVVFLSDGRLVSGSWDGSLRLWAAA